LAETNPRFKTTTDQLRGLWQILARQKQNRWGYSMGWLDHLLVGQL